MTEKDFVICSDFDDTMNTLVPCWLEWLNNKYGLNVQFEDVTTWHMKEIYPTLSEEQIFEVLADENFWKTVGSRDEACIYIPKLISEGFTFYICTSTSFRVAKAKFENCLIRLFPYINKEQIIITYNKQLIKCNVLIDDATHNIVGDYYGILMDMPHNRTFNHENVYRVMNWKEAYEKVHTLFEIEKEREYK